MNRRDISRPEGNCLRSLERQETPWSKTGLFCEGKGNSGAGKAGIRTFKR